MTGPQVIRGHDGEPVTLTDIGAPVQMVTEPHDHAEYVEGCLSCFVELPLGEQMARTTARQAANVARRRSYECTVGGCDHVAVEGHVCAAHGRRWVA